MNNNLNRREFLKYAGLGAAALGLGACSVKTKSRQKPNILWIIAEDMSAHFSCYGDTTIQTPNIDRLAAEGARFTNAYVTSPVCSPSRSAMITGMYQTTIGAHHHRSSYREARIHLPEEIKLLPRYFQEHGYYTVNGGTKTTVYHSDIHKNKIKLGKTDYNFVWNRELYDNSYWKNREPNQPFFAQLQFHGGKNRGAKVPNPVDPAKVKIPPYYPDDPVIRKDWARYLNSVIFFDNHVGEVLKTLDEQGIADNTIVILFTDHGISHARGKQFLYDEGIHIPLIIRWPGVIKPGGQRNDLVSHIDIAATSLYAAGIAIPNYMQGRSLFGRDYKPRQHVFSARDRCDETLDCIRSVRTSRYKYIRNFYPDRSHMQPNRYKNHKQIIKTMRKLFAEDKLNSLQARIFQPRRPVEELYDTKNDPYETNNLADSPQHRKIRESLNSTLTQWMCETGDLGLVPEPVLFELAKKYGSPYAVLRQKENENLLEQILEVIEIGEQKSSKSAGLLMGKLLEGRASVRFWAARKLANMGIHGEKALPVLELGLYDDSASVRVESARALCKIGREDEGLKVLVKQLKNKDNAIIRHYAALALEDIGQKAYPALPALKQARGDSYEYVKRVSNRLVRQFQAAEQQKS